MIDYKEKIVEVLSDILTDLDKEEIGEIVEVPADRSKGDFAFPCFKLAKVLRMPPPMIASDLAEKLSGQGGELFDRVEPVNAYVNIFLNRKKFMEDVVREVNEEGDDYGKSDIGAGRPVIVEFSSPNIAKPFHIGHIRSTVIGNSINLIYNALGFKVIRINHLGDYGTQFGKMICAYRKWGDEDEVRKEPIKALTEYYRKFHIEAEHNPALEQEARDTFTKLEHGEPEELELWQWFRDESLKEFNRVYEMLGIEYDSYAGESFYSDKMDRVIKELKEKNLLEESEGAMVVFLDDYGMNPAMIQKSDGSTLYITRDVAAAIYRKETYDFYKNIYVVASQQNLHFQQWIQVVDLMGYPWARDCVHVPFGLVSLEDGTMSTREGRVVLLEDVLNRAVEKTKDVIEEKGVVSDEIDETAAAVGIGAVVFNELSNNRIKDYVFSWDKVLNFDGETGPYVQYTHARACSVLRKAGQEDVEAASLMKDFDASYIDNDDAYALVKDIAALGDVIIEAGKKYEPSIVTRHIIDIAQAFNRFYHNERINVDDVKEKRTKLALVVAAKTAIKNGLALLGMKAPERM